MCILHFRYGGGASYKYDAKYTSPLRVFDNFNSKAKTLDAVNFAKIKNSKLKASRSPLTQNRVLLKENAVKKRDPQTKYCLKFFTSKKIEMAGGCCLADPWILAGGAKPL